MMASGPPPPQALPNDVWVEITKEIIDPKTGQPSRDFPLHSVVQIRKVPRPTSSSVAPPHPLNNVYDTMYDIKKKAWVKAPKVNPIASPRNYENMCPHTQIQSASASDIMPFRPDGDNQVGFLTKDFSYTDLKTGSQHLISKGTEIKVVYGPATSKGLIKRVNLSEISSWRYQVEYDPIVMVPGVKHFPYCVLADHFSTREVREPRQPPDPSVRQPNPSRQGPSGHQSRPPSTSGPSSYAPRAPSSLSYRGG